MPQAQKDYVDRTVRFPKDLLEEINEYAGRQPFSPPATKVIISLLRKGLVEATRRKAAT